METPNQVILAHLQGERPMVEAWSAMADTLAGRVHVEWDASASVTPFGQLPFFIDYLKQAGLFDAWVADCPLSLTSPNAPTRRDLLGTVLLSVLAGHRRYAHITTLRCDAVTLPLLGMRKVLREDSVRRLGEDRRGQRPALAAKPPGLERFQPDWKKPPPRPSLIVSCYPWISTPEGWLGVSSQDENALVHRAAAERAVGARHGQHGKDPLRASGRGRGRLQSGQARASLACLSHRHAVEPAPGAAGRCLARRPA